MNIHEALGLLPPDTYRVAVIDSELCRAKKGDSTYLRLTLKVLDGEKEGHVFNDMIMLLHPKEFIVAAGTAKLRELVTACGNIYEKWEQRRDSDELHHIPILALVRTDKGSNGFPPKNTVSHYLEAD